MQDESKEAVEQPGTALVPTGQGGSIVPTEVTPEMLLEDEGSGMEGVSTKDLMIPFIVILQSLSPQVKKKDPQYLEGAEEGMFLNTATNRLYPGDTGFIAIPALYQRRHTEWIPRNKGGGLVADYGTDDSCLKRTTVKEGRNVTPEGHEIVISGTYFTLLLDETNWSFEKVLISMAGTQQKKSRKWNTQMTALQEMRPDGKGTFNPASYFMSYRFTTVPESNAKGNWSGFQITPFKKTLELPNGSQLYLAAKEFKKQVMEGLVKVAPIPAGEGQPTDDEIPF